MVGVPGRSKACQACKQRRVACDQGQPECSRCVKAKRTCDYSHGRIFVQHQDGGHKSVYQKKDGLEANSKMTINDKIPPANDNGALIVHPVGSKSDRSNGVLIKQPECGPFQLQALVSRALASKSVYGDDRLGGFARAFAHGASQPSMRASFMACYCSWMARREHDERLAAASREFYVEALKETHVALMTPETALSDSTLGASHALSIYEALECPGGSAKAYMWHRAAALRLIRLRGPEAHQDGPSHRLFAMFRFFGVRCFVHGTWTKVRLTRGQIVEALEKGNGTFLSEPEWVNVPFSVHPKQKLDQLLDIFVQGPELSSAGRMLGTLPPGQVIGAAVAIVGKLVALYRKLQEFYAKFESESPTPLYWERMYPFQNDAVVDCTEDSEFAFPPTLWFPDQDTVILLTLYWAIEVMIWNGLLDLHGLFHEHGLDGLMAAAGGELGDTSPQMMEFRLLDRARRVFQSLAYCTTRAAMDFGPPRILAQLAIVMDPMRQRKACEAEYRWGVRAMRRLGEKYTRILSSSEYSKWPAHKAAEG